MAAGTGRRGFVRGVGSRIHAVSRWLYGWRGLRLLAVLILPFIAADIGPAYAARFGEGTLGVFVAERKECGRAGCSWYGDFRSDDGQIVRSDVLLASGDDPSSAGEEVRAKDTGNRAAVYPVDGGWDWLFLSLFRPVHR